jgi:peptidoglycan-N-acetylglucosamine deacetylase
MKKILLAVIFLFLIVIGLGVGFYKLINSERYQIAGEIIRRVETDQKIVALTFDDGPTEYADDILGVLQEKDVKATFYIIGDNVEQFPEAAQKIVAAGHELGNHSYTHQRMVFKSNEFIASEIEKTNDLIRKAGYQGEITFRPPFGKKFVGLPMYLKSKNMKTLTWDVEPQKFGADTSVESYVAFVKNKTQPGSIILIHPWYGDENVSRDAIGPVIDMLKAEGYSFLTVAELLQSKKTE